MHDSFVDRWANNVIKWVALGSVGRARAQLAMTRHLDEEQQVRVRDKIQELKGVPPSVA